MSTIANVKLNWPRTLPVEIAMRQMPIKDVCAAYGLTYQDWLGIRDDPLFRDEVLRARNMLKQEGYSFQFKCQMTAEECLGNIYAMITDPDAPPAIRLECVKAVVRWAGYEKDKQPTSTSATQTFAIQINL